MIEMMYLLCLGILPLIYMLSCWIPKGKNLILFLGSILCWFILSPVVSLVMIGMFLTSWGGSRWLYQIRVDRRKKELIFLSEMLLYFVLWNILWGSGALQEFFLGSISLLLIFLHAMKYSIDVFQGRITPVKEIDLYGFYLIGFPRIWISRYMEYSKFKRLYHKDVTWEQFKNGGKRFFFGMCRAILLGMVGIAIVRYLISHMMEQSVFTLWIFLPLFVLSCYHIWIGFRQLSDGLWMMAGLELKKEKSPVSFLQPLHKFVIALYPSLLSHIPIQYENGWSRKYALSIACLTALFAFCLYPSFAFLWGGMILGILVSCDAIPWVQKRPGWVRYTIYFIIVSIVALFLLGADGMTYLKAMIGLEHLPFIGNMTLYQILQYGLFYLVTILCAIPWKKKKIENKWVARLMTILMILISILLFVLLCVCFWQVSV